MIQAFLFDLMTGAVLARRGRGTSMKLGSLSGWLPAVTRNALDTIAADGEDQLELIELSTERVTVLVAVVTAAQEAIAVIADKAQPTALVSAIVRREVRAYAARLHPARGAGTAPR
jgi:hypothetical protein